MTFKRGQEIYHKRYRIVHLLGQGGFGAVYRAWDVSLGKPVALKHNQDMSLEAQQQFEREAKILGSLSHPNLPRVTDHFSIPQLGQFLVMDYIEGKDLEQIIQREGKIEQTRAIGWIEQVSKALTYLHNQPIPIIHRDIKPANIRITAEGKAYLVDFGLVKLYNKDKRTTMGARAVTPGYSPPEQYGQGNTDSRTDVYALAATLYTALTGQEPVESIQRIVVDELRLASQVNPKIEPTIGQAIAKAMSLSPTQRFRSADAFQNALRSITSPVRQDRTVQLSPHTQPPTTTPIRPASQNILLGLSGVLGVLVLMLGGLLWRGGFVGGATATEVAVVATKTQTLTLEPTISNTPPKSTDIPPSPKPTDISPSPTAVQATPTIDFANNLPRTGGYAPNFELSDSNESVVNLSDELRQHSIVLVFYYRYD